MLNILSNADHISSEFYDTSNVVNIFAIELKIEGIPKEESWLRIFFTSSSVKGSIKVVIILMVS